MSDLQHGSPSTYTNHACHCEECKRAWRDAHWEYMQATPEQKRKHAEREKARYHSMTFEQRERRKQRARELYHLRKQEAASG